MAMSEWQPIETAPTVRGSVALLYCPNFPWEERVYDMGNIVVGVCILGQWLSDYSTIQRHEHTGTYQCHVSVDPTHWMPLPAPPAMRGSD